MSKGEKRKVSRYTLTFFITIFFVQSACSADLYQAEDLFYPWTMQQQVHVDRSFDQIKQQITTCLSEQVKNRHEQSPAFVMLCENFFTHLTSKNIPEKRALILNYQGEFAQLLASYKCADEQDAPLTEQEHSRSELKKNKHLLERLCTGADDQGKNSFLMALGNRFFEACFSDDFFQQFLYLHTTRTAYPLLRFLYTTIWSSLSEIGWMHWHQDCLNRLKKDFLAGKKIVYLAGGCDFYQLLKHGIYSFTIIDPLIPSQERYYVPCRNLLVKHAHGIGDTIVFDFDDKKIFIENVSSRHMITTWAVSDHERHALGSFTIQQRMLAQEDFYDDDMTTLLISFNELFFLALPPFAGGWSIDSKELSDQTKISVKQLRLPVSKRTIMNMRVATLLNLTDFHYIALGSSIK